ncbi:MAG: hypothetical protein MUC50_17840 [Myxococcota bacterium]|jgi:uroporphyrinogen decarboxylase|nr:hypothetical protein [Myxococcota bacterium]
MNSTERLGALMRGERPDVVPLFCILLDQGASELNLLPAEYYVRGQTVAEGQARLRRKYGHDLLWGSFHASFEAQLLGCQRLAYPDIGPPMVDHFVLDTKAAIERFTAPRDLEAHPLWAQQKECLSALRAEFGGQCPIAAMVVGSLTLPSLLCGMDRWLELLLFGPATLRDHLISQCRQFVRDRIAMLRRSGVDLIAYVSSCATSTFLDLPRWRSVALPSIVADLDGVDTSNLVYFNGGGRIGPTLPDLLAHTTLRMFTLHPVDDVVSAKMLSAGRATVVGSVNDATFVLASPEEVEKEVARVLDQGMPGGGFGLGTPVLPSDIPERNIRALVESARRLGQYSD